MIAIEQYLTKWAYATNSRHYYPLMKKGFLTK